MKKERCQDCVCLVKGDNGECVCDEVEKYPECVTETQRYEAVLGFNTKQWWAYDNKTDEFCDPPTEVLEEIERFSDDVDRQEDFFNGILSTNPDWLYDEEYRYDEIE